MDYCRDIVWMISQLDDAAENWSLLKWVGNKIGVDTHTHQKSSPYNSDWLCWRVLTVEKRKQGMAIRGPGHFRSIERSKCATVHSFIQLSAVMKWSSPFSLLHCQHLVLNLEWNAVERSGASSTDNHCVVLTMLSPPRETRAEADSYKTKPQKCNATMNFPKTEKHVSLHRQLSGWVKAPFSDQIILSLLATSPRQNR